MFRLEALTAREILDSRGRPTIAATARVNGHAAEASVPSGASTGRAERWNFAMAMTGDMAASAACAVANVNGPIAQALVGKSFSSQAELDSAMIQLDGTANKSSLGANAILATSLAFARACAAAAGMPLYRHFADMAADTAPRLPQLTVNLFSGGKHAGGQVPIQDVLLVPVDAPSVAVALEQVVAVVRQAQDFVVDKYHQRPLKADEGGLAPPFDSVESMFDDAMECIRSHGLEPGKQMGIAVDVASSHFYVDSVYHLGADRLTSKQMIDRIRSWVDRWPIISVEDGLSESDWEHWPSLHAALAGKAMVLGDDLLCTNPARIERTVASRAANALLLKVNQIGTLTEAVEALRWLARPVGK